MGDWNLGSVASTVMDLVPDVPSSISGTRLFEMADRQREFVEQFTGASIGSNAISITYQNVITKLTMAETTTLMTLTGGDFLESKLGDFTVKKGAGGNLDTTSSALKKLAMEELRALGRKVTKFKANG